MKKIILISVIFIAASGFCFAEEESEMEVIESKKYSVCIYIHPLTLITSIDRFTSAADKGHLFYIYTTIEIPYTPSKSLTIRPSLYDCNHKSVFCFFGCSYTSQNLFRLGSDVGIRSYQNKKGKGDGFYLQGTVGVFYRKFEDYDFEYDRYVLTDKSKSFWEVDIMGYIGSSYKSKNKKFTMFWDVGIGIGSHPMHIIIGDGWLLGSIQSNNHFRYDVNFGIGIKF